MAPVIGIMTLKSGGRRLAPCCRQRSAGGENVALWRRAAGVEERPALQRSGNVKGRLATDGGTRHSVGERHRGKSATGALGRAVFLCKPEERRAGAIKVAASAGQTVSSACWAITKGGPA